MDLGGEGGGEARLLYWLRLGGWEWVRLGGRVSTPTPTPTNLPGAMMRSLLVWLVVVWLFVVVGRDLAYVRSPSPPLPPPPLPLPLVAAAANKDCTKASRLSEPFVSFHPGMRLCTDTPVVVVGVVVDPLDPVVGYTCRSASIASKALTWPLLVSRW